MIERPKLTANDPEPPVGAKVMDTMAWRWEHQPEGYWLKADGSGDPESWARICEFGPVLLLADTDEVTAGDVLTVLNDLDPLDMSMWTFAVITDASDGYWPFERGEVLVLDASGREPLGQCRKPAKWSVHEEHFPTLAEALECRRRVLAGEWPRSFREGT